MRFFRTYKKILPALLAAALFVAPMIAFAQAVKAVSNTLTSVIISIVGVVLTIAAYLFDSAMTYFVLQMGGLIRDSGIGVNIDLVWTVTRDLVNLTFIFGLVYVGFRTILDAGTDTKKMLASIIISALLVNFSLFISKVVIDVSNVTASEIYKQMKISRQSREGTTEQTLGISEMFLSRMGIYKLIAVPNPATGALEATAKTQTSENNLALVIGASIFILVAAFVFFASAILLVIRAGVLIVLMILSPVAFAATVFPAFKGWRDRWWHSLFSQAFFAPALLFMFYITLKMAEGYQPRTEKAWGIYDPKFFNDGYQTIVFFCLTIVLMVAGLIIAKQMGAYGATSVVGWGKKASLRVGNNLRGFVGRQTIGLAAESGAELNKALETTRLGRGIKTAVSIASLGTFTERTRRATFEAGQKAKFGGSYSLADDREWKRKHDKEIGIYNDIEDGEKATARAKKDPLAPVSDNDEKLIVALGKAISRRSTKDFEEMEVSLLSNENIAVHITGEQMKNIRKNENGKFSVADITKIDKARTNALTDAARRPTVGFGAVQGRQSLAARGENDLRQMPIEVLTVTAKSLSGATFYPMAPYITPRMIEYMMQEGATEADLNTIKVVVQEEFDMRKAANPDDPYVQRFTKWKNGNNPYGPGFNLIV
jgi:hypothetical protein